MPPHGGFALITTGVTAGSFRTNWSIEPLPEPAVRLELDPPTSFETLVAALPAGEREIVTLLKVSDMSVMEVARATSSTVGAVKQKAHRAYRRLRKLLQKDSLAGQGESGQR
jgi:RNA polymerase sigma-70 factor (ECF subfamily)